MYVVGMEVLSKKNANLPLSHHGAVCWLALFVVPRFIFVGRGCGARSPRDAFDRHVLSPLAMPPSELLDRAVVNAIEADDPFAAADCNFRAVTGEVEFGEEYLGRHGLRGGGVAFEGKGECCVPQVKAVRGDVSRCGNWTRSYECFCGSVTAGTCKVGRGFGVLG
jgi:hypothetical protein